MPDYAAMPTDVDISLLLKSNKMWPADTDTTGQALALEQAGIAVEGAVAEFEQRTGWKPFLAGAVATTRYFNATSLSGILDFGGAAQSITAVTVAGTALVVDTGYYLDRYDDDEPITQLQLTTPYVSRSDVYGLPRPRQIAVTGIWGRVTTVPGDVWVAIQKYAGVQTLASIENAQSIASLSMDGFSKGLDVVGIIPQLKLLEVWGKDWLKTIQTWTRITC